MLAPSRKAGAKKQRTGHCNAASAAWRGTADHSTPISAAGHSKGDPRSPLDPRAFTFPAAFLTCFATSGLDMSPTWHHGRYACCAWALLFVHSVYIFIAFFIFLSSFFVFTDVTVWGIWRPWKPCKKGSQQSVQRSRSVLLRHRCARWFWFDRMTCRHSAVWGWAKWLKLFKPPQAHLAQRPGYKVPAGCTRRLTQPY